MVDAPQLEIGSLEWKAAWQCLGAILVHQSLCLASQWDESQTNEGESWQYVGTWPDGRHTFRHRCHPHNGGQRLYLSIPSADVAKQMTRTASRASPMFAASCDLGEINLDCMSLCDLRLTATHLGHMARYAERKAEAMASRASGHTSRAQALEAECDRIYRLFPNNWRW